MKYLLPLVLCLSAATAAGAHPGAGDAPSPPRPASRPAPQPPAPPARTSVKMSEVRGLGIVRAIDPTSGRITISYEAIEPLNWPAGTMSFGVGRSALLNSTSVGDKVRFRLESQQIVELSVF